MLEYATHARYWRVNQMRSLFEDSCPASDPSGAIAIAALLRADSEPDVDAFWDDVQTNLKARKIRLLFVADQIPDSLANVVQFINEEMGNVRAFAVEIKQFRDGGSMQTLVPRLFGRAAARASSGSRSTTTNEAEFLARFPSEASRNAAKLLLQETRAAGARIEWGAVGVSIRARCAGWTQSLTIAWVYPDDLLHWGRTRSFLFGYPSFATDAPGFPPAARNALLGYYATFKDDPANGNASNQGTEARYIALSEAHRVEPMIGRMKSVLAELAAMS